MFTWLNVTCNNVYTQQSTALTFVGVNSYRTVLCLLLYLFQLVWLGRFNETNLDLSFVVVCGFDHG